MKSISPRTQLQSLRARLIGQLYKRSQLRFSWGRIIHSGLKNMSCCRRIMERLFQNSCSTFLLIIEGLETPAKTGRVLIGASLGNSSCLISFSVRKAKQVQQKGKVTCTAMKSLTVTGNGSQVIILTGGAHCLSEVVRNLKFVISCSFILCLFYLCSL